MHEVCSLFDGEKQDNRSMINLDVKFLRGLSDGIILKKGRYVRANTYMNEEYVLHIINLHRKALRENKVGSAIPHLNKKLFRAIEVPIPPYAEQERIIGAINFAFNRLDTIEESL